jgi:SAM-dependent methyltransferase
VSTVELAKSGAWCVAADFSVGMLHARATARSQVGADAAKLPFADESFDAVTISFGLRNVVDHSAGLREMARVTRPGGRLAVCEFSTPVVPVFSTVYKEYLMKALPKVATAVSSNPEAYVYLAESIRAWPDQAELARRIEAAGWSKVRWQPDRRHRRAARRRQGLTAGVGQHLIAGVVARDERDARPAVAARPAEVEALDRDRLVEETLGPGRFGPISSGCSRPWQKSPLGAPNMVFMWYGANVMLRIAMSLKFGAYLVILSMTTWAISFLRWPCCSRGPRGEGVDVDAGGVLALRRHLRIAHRGDLDRQRRIVRDDAEPAVVPLPLLGFRGAEHADRHLHAGLVEEIVGRGVLRQTVEREVDLQVGTAVVATAEPGHQ